MDPFLIEEVQSKTENLLKGNLALPKTSFQTCYQQWLHRMQKKTNGAGAWWFCRQYEDSLTVVKNGTNYDGEILAVCEAKTQLIATGQAPAKVVFFIESQAAILALISNTPTDCLNTIQCRTKIAELISHDWTAALQRVPSPVVIPGNERADQKAKQGAESSQPEVPFALRKAKNIISTYIDKSTAVTQKNKSLGKPWETLSTVDLILTHLERAEAVARVLLTTGHDVLRVHLHGHGLAAGESCPLCGHAGMKGDHLLHCTGID
ncbi:reverse transcriptase [Trichonephila clavipes]|nr:reverse transcriptase [Trichonephila clavipes]